VNNDLFINSARVLGQNWGLILVLLACVTWGTLLVFTILKKITEQQFADIELTALALGGWPLPALLLSLSILFLRAFIPADFIFIFALTIITLSAGFAIRFMRGKISLSFASPILIFLLFVFVRLGFVANAILPSYFDSAEHYRIIQILLSMEDGTKFAWPSTAYYHLGYHFIVAAITLITHANISQVMLLFGQIILAAIPLPIYFFVHRATDSHWAALFGVTLAAFGWFMPAHAVNWGKYPALLSLLLIQFTLGAAVIKNRWLLALAAMASVLIHTRAIILLAIFGMAWLLSAMWMDQPRNRRILLFALTVILLGMAILLIERNQILGPILEPYLIWVTLLVGLLSATVFRSFPRLIVLPIITILLMLAGIFIPVTSALTLLDRPLVEMTLFLPLAFLGGSGVARLPKFAVIVLAASIIIHAWATYNFSASDCCQLVNRDDAVALDWMDKHLPVDARIAIASTDLNLNAFGRPMRGAGTDAGIWLAPLTQRTILALPYSTDFVTQSTHDLLCQQHVTHVYVGARPQSFESNFAEAQPVWYETIFSLPNVRIVQVINCEDG
jgi:hypothetical protein